MADQGEIAGREAHRAAFFSGLARTGLGITTPRVIVIAPARGYDHSQSGAAADHHREPFGDRWRASCGPHKSPNIFMIFNQFLPTDGTMLC
jgi:hypothetical protein